MQYICLNVSIVTTIILPTTTLLKIFFFKSFSFLSTFLIIEAFKVTFVLGIQNKKNQVVISNWIYFKGIGLVNGIGLLQFFFLIEFRWRIQLSSILGSSCLTRMPRRARAERCRERYEIMVGAKKLESADSVRKIIWSENIIRLWRNS